MPRLDFFVGDFKPVKGYWFIFDETPAEHVGRDWAASYSEKMQLKVEADDDESAKKYVEKYLTDNTRPNKLEPIALIKIIQEKW